jgi:hypothetical protein
MFVGVTLTSRTRQENINLVGYYHPCHFKNGMNLPTLQNGAPSTKTWVCKGKVSLTSTASIASMESILGIDAYYTLKPSQCWRLIASIMRFEW